MSCNGGGCSFGNESSFENPLKQFTAVSSPADGRFRRILMNI
jgi:hypothetical protein